MKVQFNNGKNTINNQAKNEYSAHHKKIQSIQTPMDEVRFSSSLKINDNSPFILERVIEILKPLIEKPEINKKIQTVITYDNTTQKLVDRFNETVLTHNGKVRKFDVNESKFIKGLIDIAQETDETRISVKDICIENGISDCFIPVLIDKMIKAGFITKKITTTKTQKRARRTEILDLTDKFNNFIKAEG